MSSDLEILFSSAARVQMLHLFLLRPSSQFYQREIERETGQPIRAVQREVKRLSEMGLLSRSTEGNRVYYGVNSGYPLLAELTALFQAAVGEEVPDLARPAQHSIPPEPSTVQQPFPWMESQPAASLPDALRRRQVEGEWDQAY